MRRAAALACLFASVTGACASYQPRASRFITRTGRGTYERDGVRYAVGPLGGGAEALVAGDTRALDYARQGQRSSRLGAGVYALGLATMLVGPFVAVASGATEDVAVWSALGLGAGISIAGIGLMSRGDASLLDAINVYNDGRAAAATGGP
jgi:hypothetical protein